VDPPKVMKNGSCSAATLSGSTPLSFVISTEAKRSGEICGAPCGLLESVLGRLIRANPVQPRTLEAAEKNPVLYQGNDFSRTVNCLRKCRALAPEVRLFCYAPEFFRSFFGPVSGFQTRLNARHTTSVVLALVSMPWAAPKSRCITPE
jgi:hypothetical protein